ncbi:J domain-containing protein [Candidatus Frankia alpina]|uniref:J domain-containing protein n=1 Tax=Candidatus Frankia alpina TaxID=2699483 RepID=UPI0013D3A75C|nr:J domain-containing protein [Candidatus Frankia alpina]
MSPFDRLVRELDGTDAYAVLGVNRSADRTEIRRAYRARVRAHHPDNPASRHPGSIRAMQLIITAHELLDKWRDDYDARTGTRRPPARPGTPAPPHRPGTSMPPSHPRTALPGLPLVGSRAATTPPATTSSPAVTITRPAIRRAGSRGRAPSPIAGRPGRGPPPARSPPVPRPIPVTPPPPTTAPHQLHRHCWFQHAGCLQHTHQLQHPG